MTQKTLKIDTARAFLPLLEPSRYKGAWGGRGSGKSHFFADKLVDDALYFKGLRAVCIREVQKSLAQSSKRIIEDKINAFGLGERDGFKIFKDVIQTPGDGVIMFQGMQDHTAESIKSLEGINRAWCEEAQTLSPISLQMLRPTIRGENSELWFSWNPRRKSDPVDKLLRLTPPTDSVVVRANWSDNPWFPSVLEQERLDDLRDNPEQYDHVWEGGYMGVSIGAYYAESLSKAKLENRIGVVSRDPLLPVKLFVDIGGTGAKSDAFVMVAAQFVGHQVRVLDYYEAQGQPLEHHLGWIRESGYDKAEIYLPHDGATHDKVFNVSYESAFTQAGFRVIVVPNQGKGAAKKRIEETRRLFPSIWFNAATCEPLTDALGWYHEKRDTVRNIGLGPEHDWASHGADAFGMLAVVYSPPSNKIFKPINFESEF